MDKVDVWGRRRLAYEIDKKSEGIYTVVDMTAEPDTVKELDRQLNLNEAVLRTKIVRPDQTLTAQAGSEPDPTPERPGGPRWQQATPRSPSPATSSTTRSSVTPRPARRWPTSAWPPPRGSCDNATNEWKDGDSLFLSCNVWRQAAENVAESLQRGMRVIVQGRLRQRSYETKEGEKRTVYEIEVDEVGPSLRNASAKVTRSSRSTGGSGFGGGRSGQSGQSGRPGAAASPGMVEAAAVPPRTPGHPMPADGFSDEPPF